MQHLRANTQVIVTVGPFVDVGDGFTPQVDIALAGDEAELMKHGGTVVVDISGNTWAAVANCRGYYSLTLTTTDTNTEGLLVVIVQDDSDCLPVKQEYMVLSAAAYDSLYVAKDAGFMDVNVKTVGRADTQETEANNLESACANYSVTRGLTGTAVPAVAAEAAGGMYTRGAGAGQINQDANGRVDANVAAIETADPTDTIRDSVVDDATRIDASELNTLSGHDPGAQLGTGTSTHNAAGVKTAIEAGGSHLALIKAVTDVIPDAGALTTIGSDTARLTAVRAAVLTDWIDAGRLDALLDGIKTVTDALPNAGALTGISDSTDRLTAARAGALTDWIDGGRLDLLLDAIKAVTDNLPNSGALSDLATILTDTNELQGDWANSGRLDLLIDAILADTGTDGVVLSAAQMNKIADHIIRRTFQNACDSSDGDAKSFRSLLGAIAKLVNKLSLSGTTLTITEDDDVTTLGTQTVTKDATAEPITAVDTD